MATFSDTFGLRYSYFNDGSTVYRLDTQTLGLQRLNPVNNQWVTVSTAGGTYQYAYDQTGRYWTRVNLSTGSTEMLSNGSWKDTAVSFISATTGAKYSPSTNPVSGSEKNISILPADWAANNQAYLCNAKADNSAFLFYTDGSSVTKSMFVTVSGDTVATGPVRTLSGYIQAAAAIKFTHKLSNDRVFTVNTADNIQIVDFAANTVTTVGAVTNLAGIVKLAEDKFAAFIIAGTSSSLTIRLLDFTLSGAAIIGAIQNITLPGTTWFASSTVTHAVGGWLPGDSYSAFFAYMNNGTSVPSMTGRLALSGSTISLVGATSVPASKTAGGFIKATPVGGGRIFCHSNGGFLTDGVNYSENLTLPNSSNGTTFLTSDGTLMAWASAQLQKVKIPTSGVSVGAYAATASSLGSGDFGTTSAPNASDGIVAAVKLTDGRFLATPGSGPAKVTIVDAG